MLPKKKSRPWLLYPHVWCVPLLVAKCKQGSSSLCCFVSGCSHLICGSLQHLQSYHMASHGFCLLLWLILSFLSHGLVCLQLYHLSIFRKFTDLSSMRFSELQYCYINNLIIMLQDVHLCSLPNFWGLNRTAWFILKLNYTWIDSFCKFLLTRIKLTRFYLGVLG